MMWVRWIKSKYQTPRGSSAACAAPRDPAGLSPPGSRRPASPFGGAAFEGVHRPGDGQQRIQQGFDFLSRVQTFVLADLAAWASAWLSMFLLDFANQWLLRKKSTWPKTCAITNTFCR